MLWAAAAVGAAEAPAANAAVTLPAGFQTFPLATQLYQPTAVAWTPDGWLLTAQKGGQVVAMSPDPAVTSDQSKTVIDISHHVNAYGDRGLEGLAVDANYATNHYVYLLYVYEDAPGDSSKYQGPKVARLTRVTLNPSVDGKQPPTAVGGSGTGGAVDPSETVLLGKVGSPPCPAPSNSNDCMPASSNAHMVGTVRADPDGTLWVGEGDGAGYGTVDPLAFRSQDETTTAGKVLHVDRSGNGLAGHPFCPADNNLSDVCTKVYAKGFRNPFRFELRSGTTPIVGDVGWNSWEEIDQLTPGGNYGWPCWEGPVNTPGYSQDPACTDPQTGVYRQQTVAPTYSFDHSNATKFGIAVIGGPIYDGTNYGTGYAGTAFFGAYGPGTIQRLQLDSSGQAVGVHDFATGVTALSDLELAPGSRDLVYADLGNFAPGGGAINQITHTGTQPLPVAQASATPACGPDPLTVAFSSAGTQPGSGGLQYRWDFGDGTAVSTVANPTHQYPSHGIYHVRLSVTDSANNKDTTLIPVDAGAPTAAIAAPTASTTYAGGQQVSLSGSGSDYQGNQVPSSQLSWRVILHHIGHIHDLGTFLGSSTSFTTLDNHDADSYYTITLTATDGDGLTCSAVVDMHPRTVSLTLASSPGGAPLSYAGTNVTAPFVHTAAVGFKTSISAADSFQSSGHTYVFDHWSDAGAQLHNIVIGNADATLTAVYQALPVAQASATPSCGPTPLTVAFSSAGTQTGSGGPTYKWDFGDGSATSTAANPTHQYTAQGVYSAHFTVTDSAGHTDTTTITVDAGTPRISAPTASTTYADGQQVSLSGSGTDFQGNAVPSSQLSWHVVLNHGSHTHDLGTFSGATNSFTARDDHDADSYYTITLTSTDTQSRTCSASIDVHPQTSSLTLASSPAGAPLTYAGTNVSAPFVHSAAVGFKAVISAADSFQSSGHTYVFDHWSDAGAQSHNVVVGSSDATLTAVYQLSPVAQASATPSCGPAPLTVAFSSAGTQTGSGGPTYKWDFGDGSAVSTAASPSHQYTTKGVYSVGLTVTDSAGHADRTTITVDAGEPTITAPSASTTYADGQTVSLSGSGTDYQGNAVPSSQLSWHVVLNHGSHTHDLGNFTGTSTSFTARDDHDADSYYTITLIGPGTQGQTCSASVDIRPQTSSLTLASSPAGAPLTYAGTNVTAPFVHSAAVGFKTSISAAGSFQASGHTYVFDHWSDAGAQSHNIVVGSSDATLTAVYQPLPVAQASAAPSCGLTVGFSSAGTQPGSGGLTYKWDFGDGSAVSTAANPSHQYAAGGVYSVGLTVTDSAGHSDTTAVSVDAEAPTITAPSASTTYADGQSVALSGSGTGQLSWHVVLNHASHTHDLGTFAGATTSFIARDDHDTGSDYTITLTVTDTQGQTCSTSVDVQPQTVSLTLASTPAGAPLTYAESNVSEPFVHTAAVGFRTSISAANSFQAGGHTYAFDYWSDGGGQLHNIVVASSDATLTAAYRDVTASGPKSLGVTPINVAPISITQPPTGAQATSSGPTSPSARPSVVSGARVVFPSQVLLLLPSGDTTLRADCRSYVRCGGSVGIYLYVTTRSAQSTPSRRLLLGQARFSIAPGRTAIIRLRLNGLAASILHSHTSVAVALRATSDDPSTIGTAVGRPIQLQRGPKRRR